MEYRPLGRTGVKVSPVCLGCMMFGAKSDEANSMEVVDRALDAGINFFDTANVYSRGVSEEHTGKALARNGKRARVVLATKVHSKMDDQDPNAWGNSRRHILEQCDASLRRLQTDWIDLYQIHRPSPDVPIDETLRALDDLVRSGKVRYIGTSTFGAWQYVDALHIARELGLNRFVSEQPPYHLLDRRIERDIVPMAQNFGVALIPWAPLASGFLTGKYRKGQPVPADARLKNDGTGRSPQMFSDASFAVLAKVEEIARRHNCAVSAAALSWVMNQPGITAPIIGPRNVAQMTENLGALNVKLTDQDRKELDEVSRPGSAIVNYYEADFAAYRQR